MKVLICKCVLLKTTEKYYVCSMDLLTRAFANTQNSHIGVCVVYVLTFKHLPMRSKYCDAYLDKTLRHCIEAL